MLLCALLLGLTSVPARAICRPENRVGKIFSDSPKSASADLDQTLERRGENPGCGYDFASGVHKYLYAEDEPVNMVDPSGLDPYGHHLVPRKIWKNDSQRVKNIWDAEKNRLDAKGYKLHDSKEYGKVSRDEYTRAVDEKLKEYLKAKGKTSAEDLSDEDLQDFANEIRDTSEGPIAEYNEAVAEEILSTTVEGAESLETIEVLDFAIDLDATAVGLGLAVE